MLLIRCCLIGREGLQNRGSAEGPTIELNSYALKMAIEEMKIEK